MSREQRHEYPLKLNEIQNSGKGVILSEFTELKAIGKLGKYLNHEDTTLKILLKFEDKNVVSILVIGRTQVGKTTIMMYVIESFIVREMILYDHIFVITGLSDIGWLKQTTERFPSRIKIYHRNQLNHFVEDVKDKKNILIILDEVHIASKNDQSIYKAFRDAGLLDMDLLYKNDIKFLEFSATPNGVLYDLDGWKDASSMIIARPGIGYVGTKELLSQGRIKQYKDIHTTDNVDAFNEIRDDLRMFDNRVSHKLYHLIRTKPTEKQDDMIEKLTEYLDTTEYKDNYGIKRYDGRKGNDFDINALLNTIPEKHTFIFIKEKLRCSKTLIKKYIGIVYDRFSKNVDDSSIIQGLVGRMTGYDDNGISRCYTQVECIERYEKLSDADYNDPSIPWTSNTTRKRNGITESKDTFFKNENYQECENIPITISQPRRKILIEKFRKDETEELKAFIKNKWPGSRPRKMNDKPKNGFYECSIRGDRKPYSCQDVELEQKYELKKYRILPCYENIADPSTLQWWLTYYE